MYKIFFNKVGPLNNAIPFDPNRLLMKEYRIAGWIIPQVYCKYVRYILQGEVLGWCKWGWYKKAPTQEREVGAGGIGAGSG